MIIACVLFSDSCLIAREILCNSSFAQTQRAAPYWIPAEAVGFIDPPVGPTPTAYSPTSSAGLKNLFAGGGGFYELAAGGGPELLLISSWVLRSFPWVLRSLLQPRLF